MIINFTIKNKLLESSTLNWEEVKDLCTSVLKFLGTVLQHRRNVRDGDAGNKGKWLLTSVHMITGLGNTGEFILELMRND